MNQNGPKGRLFFRFYLLYAYNGFALQGAVKTFENLFLETDHAIFEGVDCVIFAKINIFTRSIFGSALPDDHIANGNFLATKCFDA